MAEFTSSCFLFFYGFTVSCALISAWLFNRMRLEINAKLPDNEKIGVLFGYPGLLWKVERIHRRLYPRSALRLVLNFFIFLGMLSIVALGWAYHTNCATLEPLFVKDCVFRLLLAYTARGHSPIRRQVKRQHYSARNAVES
jgi:hypothetical protein